MIRSAILAALLALAVALFSLASWGRTEINDPARFAASSTAALQSNEVRSLITDRIVQEVWSRFDAQKEIASALPPEAEILSGPAAFASRAALASAVDNILKTDFARNIWEESIRIAHRNTLRALQNKNSALLIQQEKVSLDVQAILRAAARQLGLPAALWQNIPPGLGQITLAETTSAAQVQRVYGFVNIAPPILLIVSVLLLVLLLLVSRKNIWQGFAWAAGAFALAGGAVLLSRDAFPLFVTSSIEDPLSSAITEAIWQSWSVSISQAGEHLFLLAGALALVALLLSPALRGPRQLLREEAKTQYKELRKRWQEKD